MTSHPGLRAGVLIFALSASVLTGCGDDEEPSSSPVAVAKLPDNLCDAVPEEIVSRWDLAESDHATQRTGDRSEARCSMTGEAASEQVTLELSLTSYGGASADAVRSTVADELTERCADLEETAVGRFVDERTRCSTETGAGPEQGRVVEISRSVPAHGVVSVSMTHHGQMWQLVGAEVVALSGTLANSDPDELA